jgi:hypothetical protein
VGGEGGSGGSGTEQYHPETAGRGGCRLLTPAVDLTCTCQLASACMPLPRRGIDSIRATCPKSDAAFAYAYRQCYSWL